MSVAALYRHVDEHGRPDEHDNDADGEKGAVGGRPDEPSRACTAAGLVAKGLVGEAAKNQATANPEQTLFDVKRLIGRKYTDKTVKKDKTLLPFKIVEKNEIQSSKKKESKKEKFLKIDWMMTLVQFLIDMMPIWKQQNLS